ncbi:hypothetical protein BDA99DRAFT_517766 [Phascolomyces articulosus]|uniref:Actin cytoskeleton-regulatory complex protein PAN1 n=1 Tax=Phascolomyces articulosus TaxID=60185 RepID=A0AAD5PB49_9FUNG|nr:hypothetical protein BDA99DRAFT_517766 [Phascolomyces articulosus]
MYTTMGHPPPVPGTSNPSGGIRLSFITPSDQAKFEDLFTRAAASSGSNNLPAMAARDILTKSRLDNESLAKIWDLCSIANAPHLTFPEFAVAMYLTSEKLRGKLIPNALPPAVREETELAMATLASKQSPAPQQSQPQLQQQMSFMQPQQTMMTGMPQQPMMTGMPQQPMMTGMPPQQQQFNNTSFQNLMHPSNLSAPIQTPVRTGIAPPMYNNNTPRLGNQDFTSKMMPNQAGGPPNLMGGGSGRFGAAISWKISPEEKQRYREIFRAWNTPGEDYMSGEIAREVLMQSGLAEQDLMKIWHLADRDNHGSLDEDEFGIAMHLIYRKLNNFELPNTLPRELAPPSSVLKKFVLGRQTQPPPPSFSRDPEPNQQQRSPSQHAQDRDMGHGGYVSSARRKGPASRFTSSSAARPRMQSYNEEDEEEEYSSYREADDPYLEELRGQIADMKKALERATRSQRRDTSSSRFSTEELKEKIRKTQEELTRAAKTHPKYFENQEVLLDLLESQKTLQDEIQYLCNRDIPVLARQLRGATAELRDTKVRYARKNDGSQDFMDFVQPTGPGGIVTESDRVRAKAKAMMAARKAGTSSTKDTQFELRKAEDEKENYDRQADTYERDMERARDSLRDLRGDLRYLSTLADSKAVVEKKRFDKGHELPYELRRFVEQLERDAALDIATSPRFTPASTSSYGGGSSSYAQPDTTSATSSPAAASTSSRSVSSPRPAAPAKPRTAEEIKKEAERRVQERLAALQAKRSPSARSPKPASPAVTATQPNDEALAAQQRLRDAEQQAQAKIRSRGDESIERATPSTVVENFDPREAALQREQAERETEQRRIQEEQEYEQRRIEEEKELEARRKAVLEKEEQARLARHAAIQKAEEEREEQRRLEQEAEKKAMSPPAAAPPVPVAPPATFSSTPPPPPPPAPSTEDASIPPPPPAPEAPTPSTSVDAASSKASSNNPFAKLQQNQEEPKKEEEKATVPEVVEEQPAPVEKQPNSKRISYNPFAAFSAFSATKANDDESDSDDDDGWDVVHHDDSDNEDEFPAAGSAKNLAGMLFNAMSQRKSPMMQPREISPPAPSAPAAAAAAAAAADVPAPPPPPPAATEGIPPSPAPPAPVAPPAPAAPPAAPSSLPEPSAGRNALLSQIQLGTKLKKAVTNDRSQASVSGKVIGGGESSVPAASFTAPPPTATPSQPIEQSPPPSAMTPSSNFLAELQARTTGGVAEESSPTAPPTATAAAPVPAPAPEPAGKEYVAQWAYTGDGEGDLSFEQDATIVVLNDSDPDWWYGSVKGLSQTGYFPKAYVQEPGKNKLSFFLNKVYL